MSKLRWDDPGKRYYTTGIDRGVFYPPDEPGIAWNGLISVKEAASGAGFITNYVDGIKFQTGQTIGEFEVAVTAFTYPPEFSEFMGYKSFTTQQERKVFGFSYRSLIGNDIDGVSHAYQIHIIYNSVINLTDSTYDSISDTIEAMDFNFDLSTKPVFIPGGKPSAHLIIDTRVAHSWTIQAIENLLYGTDFTQPKFPTVEEIIDLFEENAILRITDNGDGTWTADGPDSAITMLDAVTFQINWPSAVYIDDVSYTISSM